MFKVLDRHTDLVKDIFWHVFHRAQRSQLCLTLTPVTFTARTALVYGSVRRSCLVKYYSCYRKPQTSMTTIDHQKRLTRKATILPSIIFHFPASRGLSQSLTAREDWEEGERPLPRSGAFFHVAADQICGRNRPVFKTGFRYARMCMLCFHCLLQISELTSPGVFDRLFLHVKIKISRK